MYSCAWTAPAAGPRSGRTPGLHGPAPALVPVALARERRCPPSG